MCHSPTGISHSPSFLTNTLVFLIVTFLESVTFLIYCLQSLKPKDVPVSKLGSCNAVRRSLCFAIFSRMSVYSVKKLKTFSDTPLSSPSTIVIVSAKMAIITIFLADHVTWAPFRPRKLLVITAFHCHIGLHIYTRSMPLLVQPLQLMSTKIKVSLWWQCTYRVHTPLPLPNPVHS